MDNNEVWLWSIIVLAIFFILGITVVQVQETNRKFIEKGYTQVQKVGAEGYIWISK